MLLQRPRTPVARTVRQYQITARIGGGGMGVVYKARDLRLKRWVALKFPTATSGAEGEAARQRLLVEAQVAATLSHQNVCTVLNLDSTEEGQPFIVMPFYEGRTIKQRLIANRDTCLLFDTPKLVRALEDLYRQMWADFEAGNLPRPDLGNLDVYHSVGTELGLDGVGSLPDEAYAKRWEERLDLWNANFPMSPDRRMWRGS